MFSLKANKNVYDETFYGNKNGTLKILKCGEEHIYVEDNIIYVPNLIVKLYDKVEFIECVRYGIDSRYLITKNGSVLMFNWTDYSFAYWYFKSHINIDINFPQEIIEKMKEIINTEEFFSKTLKKMLNEYCNTYIKSLEKRVQELETHIKYMPEGEGYYEAYKDWEEKKNI